MIYVVYWTMSNNTGMMAEAVAEGIKEAGVESEAVMVSMFDPSLLNDASAFALGCPAMGAETLEEGEMEPFVADLEASVDGKNVALFGSYGWGDGQWMRDWVDRMEARGAKIVNGEGYIVQETPDDAALEGCRNLGKALAETVK